MLQAVDIHCLENNEKTDFLLEAFFNIQEQVFMFSEFETYDAHE